MAGSNDLNLLLKAKVVKLKVELDYKGSKLPAQVDSISKKLANKPVKLKVKLDVTIKDLNAQLGKLHAKLGNSKSMKPVKIAVQIDVKGSAQNIKKQLDEVYKTVEKFNQQYGKQIQQMQQKTQQASNNIASSTKNQANAFGGAIDPSAYMKSLKDAERYMKTTFGKGLFSSQELKDANGVLTGFTTSLTKANGVVQKIHYQWNQNKGTFTPVSQKTMTDTERTIANAKKALQNLYSDIEKLDKGKGQSNLFKSYQELEKRASQGTLNMDMVSGLQRMIKEEGVLQSQIRLSNDELLKQKKLLADIEKAKKADWKATGDFERRKQYTSLANDVKSNPNLKEQAFQLARINDLSQKQIKDEKELIKNTKQRMQALKQIRELDSKIVSNNSSEKALAREAKMLAQRAKSAQEWLEVQKRINSLQQGNSDRMMRNTAVKYEKSIESNLRRLVDLGKMTEAEFNRSMAQLPITASRSFADLERQFHVLNNRIRQENEEMKRIANQTKMIFAGNSGQAQGLKGLVGDVGSGRVNISELQNYFGAMYKGKVETMSMIDTTDRLGRAVTEMKIKMAGTGKQVQTYTVQMERASGALRQTAQSLDYNANRNLGVFEQLKIAMARVPVWMMAMTAFYGSIRTVKEMTSEILQLDKALTELRRVADKQINIDHVFKGAIDLSKELGNNIHDVMQSVNDLARTFGDFNERQLLSIARTATLMSNVSDLTAQEATESLIGTMNAFNITAEESIRIVDSMNEVDNNYAISTKQLATGLAKSASTAKTFGVTMEENIGHITAIGAVTMESGNIIGNSLKTIYSRITTIQDAKDILESVGVSIYDMEGKILPTNQIIKDLAGRWRDLSDEQRQNIGVTVAGRYQLSRFLALMNNYNMATKATQTAMTSQGSAIRENAQYMKSFEARINQLKNGFTELSNAMGEAFLSSGLSIGISALTSLANVAVKVIDTMGALPTLFGLITVALLKFGVFGKIQGSITTALNGIITSVKSVNTQTTLLGTTTARTSAGVRASWTAMATGVRASATAIATTANTMFGTIRAGFTSLMASTGIGLAFVALGFAIEWVVKKFSETKAEQEELIKTNEKMVDSYRKTGDGMESMFKRYDQLATKKEEQKNLSQDERDELALLTNQFAEQLPLTVKYYTASGEAVLKTTDEIREQIKAVKELSAEQAKLDNMKLQENVKKGSEDYLKNLKKVKKIQDQMKNMKNNAEIYNAQYNGQDVDVTNSTAYQELKVKEMMLNQKLTGSMQDVVSALQKQSLAYFEANGKMTGFTDGQIGVIERMSLMNESFIRTADNEKEFMEVTDSLIDSSIRVGEVFSDAFNIMSEGIKDNPKALEDLRKSLDGVAQSIPDDFLKFDKNDPVGETNRITTGLKELINVSTHVKDGTADNFNELAKRLEATGMSSEDAKNAVFNLANEYNNAKLKAEASAQGVDGFTSSVEDMNEALLQSVDVIEEVFGYGSQDFSALKSQIELMEILYSKYGEGAEKNASFIEAQQIVAETLGVTSEKVKENIHDYNLVFQALQDLKVVTDEQGGSYLNITEITKGMTQAQKDLLNEVLNAKQGIDGISGVADEAGKAMDTIGKSVIDTREKVGEPFPTIKAPTIEDTGFKNQFNDVLKTRQTLLDNSKTLSGIIGEVNSTGKNLGSVQSDLQNVGKEADTTKNKAKEAGTTMSQAFASASKSVATNTNAMNAKHDSQTSKLNILGASARDANRDISGLNSNAVNSMNTLSKLQSRMNTFNAQAQSASANINNRFAQNSVNPLSYNSADNTLAQSISSFSATSEGVGGSDSFSVSGGGGEGTSGIIRTPINQFVDKFTALHNTGGIKPSGTSSSSASSSTKKTTSTKSATKSASDTKKKAEELAELYVIDMLARKRTGYETTLNALEAKLKGLSENTKAYRDQLRKVYEYENLVLNINKEELTVTRQKNQNITKRLNELKNVTKHTKEQREEYNKLQQEYDSNLSKIASLTGTIENAIVDLRKKSESIFLDFVDEIINNFDKAFKAIEGRIDNLDFEMEVLELTDPENITDKIDILINKTVEYVRQRNMLEKERKRLETDVATAVQKYGANSESVAKLNEELAKNQEAWEDVTISILRAEKEVRDTRGAMADKIVDLIKNNYKEMEKSATTAIDNELKALKKAHDEKIKIYDDEIKKINEVYDAKLKSLDKEKDEDNYEKEKDEKVKNLTELQKKEAQYSRDNTLEGRKKYAEIQEERKKAQEDLDEFIKNRQLELLKEQLNSERDALIEGIEQKKDAESESNDAKIESLETEKEAISAHYASITEDEKRWAKIREELIKGNFGVVKTELESMGITLEQISNGTFDTLSANFATYSEQVRNFVNEMNSMIGQISTTQTSSTIPSGGTQNGAGIGNMTAPYLVPEIIRKAKNGVKLDDPTADKNNIYGIIKNSSIDEETLYLMFQKAQKGEAMSHPTAEKNMIYDLFLEILGRNKNKVPRFNTGGYTGNWSDNSGRLAFLDKKELVLNEGQTSDVLDIVEILGRVANVIPSPNRSTPRVDDMKFGDRGAVNNYELTVQIDKLNGDKSGADLVVKELMKGLKKMGK